MRQLKRILALFLILGLWGGAALAANPHTEYVQGEFKTGPDVTRVCLDCHEQQAEDFMKTSHWTWALEQEIDGKKVAAGKRNVLNNYCTQIKSNETSCNRCHAGYGFEDDSFDFSDKTRVDCLVCHDTTGTYVKGDAGWPAEGLNLLRIAQNVGAPVRDNCGACHFYGGGGDAVKHGDLDSSMSYPESKTDIHMGLDGQDFSCQSCHVTKNHVIPGNSLGVSPGAASQLRCEDCHAGAVHQESRLNDHAANIACQTCHIPYYAKEIPTKIWWDWSTAGDDSRDIIKDKYGLPLYVKKKGDMKYGKMVQPEYAWFETGEAINHVRGQKIKDPNKVLMVAGPTSTIKDKKARIYPFKVMGGKQAFDPVNKTLLAVHQIGDDGYWTTFDWKRSAEIGMKAAGLPFSGEVDFIETRMYWRLNHMVSPASEALNCLDCHGDNGRLNWKALGYKGDPMVNPKWARSK
ncbi:tetrathionate reductase family octaheme c-type cytochrome [Desulfuromonas sp. AOP6]|uniref:tetrathionate reductase family octaheme c-type cytochrome n=1 Tax=Desulfuromonas sp. AOP6 TaxID=1566351 RepID=UPI00128AD0D0|nr:tetrathionate reductase family octaheme c-type cytochrome [Desulfuromonas sp. AOP6]BCA81180.1 cytochrome c [Desulfuromonas sp. AOP6]